MVAATPAGERLCGCECGGLVKHPERGRRFLPGHNMRVAGINGHDEPGEYRLCPNCGMKAWVIGSRLGTWRGCTRACSNEVRSGHSPWCPLQIRIAGERKATRTSMTVFADKCGVSDWTLNWWFRNKGSTIGEEILRKLAAHFDISFEKALEEAGGRTSKQRMIEEGRTKAHLRLSEHRKQVGPNGIREIQRKATAAKRGLKKSPEHIAKVLAAQTANGTQDRFMAAGRANAQSIKGRARRALTGHLNGNGPSHPDLKVLQEWAPPIAERLGIPENAIVTIWRDWLRAHGIGSFGGRPQEIDWPQVHEWRTQVPPVKWEVIAARLDRSSASLQTRYGKWRRGAEISTNPPSDVAEYQQTY